MSHQFTEVDLICQGTQANKLGRTPLKVKKTTTNYTKTRIVQVFSKDLWVRTEGVITRNSNKELLLYNKTKTNYNCGQDTEPEQKLLLIILKVLQDLQEGKKNGK